jgi:hypothetical protein
VVTEEEEAEQQAADDPTISLQALIGTQPRSERTMQLPVVINKVVLIALLNSGSTRNFVETEAAARAGITLQGRTGLRVTVANGDRITSPGSCPDLHINIGGEHFNIACYGLSLSSYDMVLEVQWLEPLEPILWDFKHRTVRFVRDGHTVLWSAEQPAPVPPALLTVSGDLMEGLLLGFAPLFTEPTGLPPQWGRCHQIRLLPGTPPVAVRPYRYAHHQKLELERQCAEMLRTGVIRPSSSAFSAPVLLVKKSNDSWRFCVDYRALNAKTVKDKFPIPVVEELLNELRGASFFTKLDLRSGYHLLMHPEDIEKTAFRTHEGLFEFLVMPFSLTNVPATFQALMNAVMCPYLRCFVLVLFNNILIFSNSWSEHLRHVQLILTALQEHQLFVKCSKCSFGARSVAYLGHVISEVGVAMDPQKVHAVLDWPIPRMVRTVWAFLGLTGYYRRFIKEYDTIATPLTALLTKDGFR